MSDTPEETKRKLRRLRYAQNTAALKRTIILDETVMEELRPAAARRNINVMELCNKILEAVADDDLVDGILDDLDEPKVSIASRPGTTTRVRYPGTPALHPDNHNAHVVASVQDRHSRGAYKPLAREFREQGPV